MTQLAPVPAVQPNVIHRSAKGSVFLRMLRTTDPKDIAILYLITSFGFFLAGGVMALLIRGELAVPGLQFLSTEQYNQLFTMHGTAMLLLYATPILFGFANYIVPLQIGAPDVAFPRLNAFSYWLFLFGSLIVLSGFLTPGGPASFGWTAYAPLHSAQYSPGAGSDLWIAGLIVSGLGTILGAVNFITTIVCMRAPGMTMFRMSIFTWNILVTAILILIAFPVLTAGLFGMLADRHLGAHVFDPANGGEILWQHLFWYFGHPEVYIIALPFFGIVSEVLPVFSRKPVFGYKGLVCATLAIGALSTAVWAHHLYATGAVLLPFFSFTTFMIAVPTGVKFVNWIGTMWKGRLTFETPMLFSVGFLVTFLLGGLDGVLLASPPLDFHVSDTLLRGRALPLRAVRHHRVRHLLGHLLLVPEDDRPDAGRDPGQGPLLADHRRVPPDVPRAALARQRGHAPPVRRLPAHRRLQHAERDLLDRRVRARASTLPFLWNVFRSYRYGRVVKVDDPWGFGNSLEWATSCPPPRHNFTELPRIRSERPAFDLHYPEYVERFREEAHVGGRGHAKLPEAGPRIR